MLIYYRLNDGSHPLEIEPEWTVAQLKEKIDDIPEDCLHLYCRGKPLQDDEKLISCIQDQDTVDVTLGLLGGKVHGSLAGAGKVKGQTPKVEKQEKKKKKTGRGKRRMQYNRRFVSTVASVGGRKRGPNAQST